MNKLEHFVPIDFSKGEQALVPNDAPQYLHWLEATRLYAESGRDNGGRPTQEAFNVLQEAKRALDDYARGLK